MNKCLLYYIIYFVAGSGMFDTYITTYREWIIFRDIAELAQTKLEEECIK